MAEEYLEKSDIEIIFKRLRSISSNKSCFDCNAKNPTWASVTYGVFICIDCSAVHRGLGVHLSFVRSTQLDTHWTWLQIRHMQLGGNVNALTFFRQHNCDSTDAQVKYNSRAAQLYKDKLDQAALQAMKLHGTKLHLDGGSVIETRAEEKKSADFFDTIMNSNSDDTSGFETSFSTQCPIKPAPTSLPALTKVNNLSNSTTNLETQTSPKVDGAFSSNSSASLTNHVPTIGRKIPAKRAGLGARKPGGLGAQKVKANFAEIEREAELADQLKESIETNKKSQVSASPPKDQSAKMASMRLAYQDLSLQQKKEEEKLKQVDPKKAQQMERLGMGFSGRGEIHHSALSDMQIIKQDTPYVKPKPVSSLMDYSLDDSFSSFLSKMEKSKDSDYVVVSPSKSERSWTDSDSKSSIWDKPTNDIDSLWNDNFSSNTSPPKSISNNNWERTPDSPSNSHSSNFSKPSKVTPAPKVDSASSDIQKKFGGAKSISSAQYFGDNIEEKCNLSRFEGSTSISSADLFGGGNSSQDYAAGYAPDLDDVKESVRQGVTKVAGKLSSLANGVMSSIQEKYGGY